MMTLMPLASEALPGIIPTLSPNPTQNGVSCPLQATESPSVTTGIALPMPRSALGTERDKILIWVSESLTHSRSPIFTHFPGRRHSTAKNTKQTKTKTPAWCSEGLRFDTPGWLSINHQLFHLRQMI